MAVVDEMGSLASRSVFSQPSDKEREPGPYLFRIYHVMEDTSCTSPSERSGHSALLCGSVMIVFGGFCIHRNTPVTGKTYSGVWVYHMVHRKWERIPFDQQDAPTKTASATVCLVNNQLLTFGGSGSEFGNTTNGDCYAFDFQEKSWSTLECDGTLPTPVYGHSMALDAFNQDVYVFGGTTGHDYSSDVHSLSLTDNTWSLVQCTGTSPLPRYSHRIVACRDCFYVVFGGTGPAVHVEEQIYRFQYSTHRWSTHPCAADDHHGYPLARRSHAIACNSRYTVMCGGEHVPEEGDNVPLDDIWRLELPAVPLQAATDDSLGERFVPMPASWRRLPASLKHPSFFHTAVLSESNSLCVFGGNAVVAGVLKRVNDCYHIYVDVPPLAEMAWRCINSSFPWLKNLPSDELRQIGFPPVYRAGLT